jgi:hypothetical protein
MANSAREIGCLMNFIVSVYFVCPYFLLCVY